MVSPGWPMSNYSFPSLLCKSLCFLTKCRKRWNILQSRQSNILTGHESKVTFEHQTQVHMHKFKPSLSYLWSLWASPYLPYSQCRNAHWCRTHGPSVSPLFFLWYLSLCLALWCTAHPPGPTHWLASKSLWGSIFFNPMTICLLVISSYIIHCKNGV